MEDNNMPAQGDFAHHITRPALCLERLSMNAAGQVAYQLKTPFRDGTTHVLFTPQDFIARLAALVPRPRVNLTRYHGVFAPNSPMRRAIMPTPAGARQRLKSKISAPALTIRQHPEEPPTDRTDPPTAPLTWARRLKRVFEIDIILCPERLESIQHRLVELDAAKHRIERALDQWSDAAAGESPSDLCPLIERTAVNGPIPESGGDATFRFNASAAGNHGRAGVAAAGRPEPVAG